MSQAAPTDLTLSAVEAVSTSEDGTGLVVKAVALSDGKRSDVEIAITTDLAAAVAIELLAKTTDARAERDSLVPALDVLAAAVVPSEDNEKLRLQLLFESGSVLPVEMPIDAGAALTRDLIDELDRRVPAAQA